jgi:hypothetical protein
MQSTLLHETDGKRTFAVILQMRCLQDFAGHTVRVSHGRR